MVDETNVPDTNSVKEVGDAAQTAADHLDNLNDIAMRSQTSLNGLNRFADMTQNIFSRLDSEIKKVGISLNVTESLTTQQTEQFGLLSTAVLGAKNSFNNLGSGVDATGLNTFASQINELIDTLNSKGTAPAVFQQGIKGFVEVLNKAGAPINDVNRALSGGVKGLKEYATNFFNSADNAIKLQNAVIQLSAKTGDLNNVFKLSGPNLQNINVLLEKHSQLMTDAATATGAPIEQVEKYYGQLGTIPGAMSALVVSSGNADKSLSMLTATMKVATGTGRSVEEVTQDMRVAFRDYGITGESALKFSTRISEVTNNLGVELDTVKSALTDTANTFKMFAGTQEQATRMSEGFARTLNSYSQSLMSTGLNGNQAVDVIQNMTKQIGNLSIAQKSFLSAQTGGPGGLMGAFQIDKMMREGKVSEVFEKVRQQMMKQFGTLVTVDDAARSPQAAAQMTRQMMTLRQGPLGQFARNDVEAQRILEGFKARNEGRVSEKGLSDKIVQESMDKGTAVQEKSYTVLNEINSNIAAIRGNANISIGGLAQKALTASTGTGPLGGLSDAQIASKANLRSTMNESANMDEATKRRSLNFSVKNNELRSSVGANAVKSIKGMERTVGGLGSAIKAPLDVISNTFSTENATNPEKSESILKEDINNRKSNPNMYRNILEDGIKKTGESSSGLNLSNIDTISSGVKVGAAAKQAMNTNAVITSASNTKETTGDREVIKNNDTTSKNEVMVHVTGFCLKCKQEIDNGSQMNSMNPASKT